MELPAAAVNKADAPAAEGGKTAAIDWACVERLAAEGSLADKLPSADCDWIRSPVMSLEACSPASGGSADKDGWPVVWWGVDVIWPAAAEMRAPAFWPQADAEAAMDRALL